MVISIFLVSSNRKFNEFFQSQRQALIPRDLIKKGKKVSNLSPEFRFKVYNPKTQSDNCLESFLLLNTKESDAVIVLVEEKFSSLINNTKAALFCVYLSFPESSTVLKNYFSSIFARLLKNFGTLVEIMSQSDNEQAMVLPVRNFKSKHMKELIKNCIENTLSPTFNNILAESVKELKKLKQPRRNSKNKMKYFVDDESKHFEYGKEKHGKLPTGKPHLHYCVINGNFRFGKKIATDKHFNVTKLVKGRTSISGEFSNCHDEKVNVQNRTHINMFSNDSL